MKKSWENTRNLSRCARCHDKSCKDVELRIAQPKTEWEEEFELNHGEVFYRINSGKIEDFTIGLKKFIRQLISQVEIAAEKRGYERGKESQGIYMSITGIEKEARQATAKEILEMKKLLLKLLGHKHCFFPKPDGWGSERWMYWNVTKIPKEGYEVEYLCLCGEKTVKRWYAQTNLPQT